MSCCNGVVNNLEPRPFCRAMPVLRVVILSLLYIIAIPFNIRFSMALRFNHAPSRVALSEVLVAGFRDLTSENVHHLESVVH